MIHTIKLNDKQRNSPFLEIDTKARRYRVVNPKIGISYCFSLSGINFENLTADEVRRLKFQLPMINIVREYLLGRLRSSESTKAGLR